MTGQILRSLQKNMVNLPTETSRPWFKPPGYSYFLHFCAFLNHLSSGTVRYIRNVAKGVFFPRDSILARLRISRPYHKGYGKILCYLSITAWNLKPWSGTAHAVDISRNQSVAQGDSLSFSAWIQFFTLTWVVCRAGSQADVGAVAWGFLTDSLHFVVTCQNVERTRIWQKVERY